MVPKPDFKSVDDYIAAQSDDARDVLQRVRSVIRKALPKAEEVISYNIPAYRLHDKVVLYFAGWKQHFSLYPIGARLTAVLKNELAQYEFNNKGTVRFPLSEPVPVKLIERIAKLRAAEVTQKTAAAEPKKARVRKSPPRRKTR